MQRDVRAIAERYEAAARALAAVEDEYAATLLAANRDGLTWEEVARAAGLRTANQARARAERAMGVTEVSPSRRRAGARNAPVELPGVSVAEAARRLGVARSTVYDRIDRGELATTPDHLGRTRVLLPDE